jgi:RNA-directed DNA polymerase (EC 2.7.7.49)
MTDDQQRLREGYRQGVVALGKREFTLLKMQEYGFWPKNLPTPYERQRNETEEQFEKRQELSRKYTRVVEQIARLYEEKDEINDKLKELRKEYDETWDIDKIRTDIAKRIMEESKVRRAERKKQRELEKQQRSEAWQKKKAEEILFIGKGYSKLLKQRKGDENKLSSLMLPIIKN